MNHFFFEVRGRERVKELRNEGLVNQVFHRNKPTKPNILHGLWGGISKILRFVFRNPQAEKKAAIESRTHI